MSRLHTLASLLLEWRPKSDDGFDPEVAEAINQQCREQYAI